MIKGVKPYAPHYQKYNGLGGKFNLEDNNNPTVCAIREVKEESGLTITNPTYLGKILFSGMFPGKEWLVHMFLCYDFEGELKQDENEGKLHWANIKNTLPDVSILEGDKYFVPWILTGRTFEAHFIYNDRDYISHTVTFFDGK